MGAKPARRFLYRGWSHVAYLEDDKIVFRECDGWEERSSKTEYPELETILKKHGYRAVHDQIALSVLRWGNGMSMAEFEAELERKSGAQERKRELAAEHRNEWKLLSTQFERHVIGLDSIDFYDQGFTVSWLLNSTEGFDAQRMFIRGRTREIATYTHGYLSRGTGGRCRKAAGLLSFCRLENVILTRSNRLELKYGLKKAAVDVLTTPGEQQDDQKE